MANHGKYYGTYKVRAIGKNEQGIHLPEEFTGDYAIYGDDTGLVTLVPMGERRG